MKVCKVVFNSVSHDARVLKEAQAIRDLGHDVVILGIQDANNRRPIDVLENGVAIRRVAWNSAVMRPVPWAYAGMALLLVAAAALLYWGIVELAARWPQLTAAVLSWLTWHRSLMIVLTLSAGLALAGLGRSYVRRRRSFKSISKRENDEALKYQAELEKYHRSRAAPVVPPDAVPSPAAELARERRPPAARRRHANWWHRVQPRPLMSGLQRALTAASLRRWKTIWARESRIRRVLESERPDVIHAHDVTALAVCAEYKRRHGCRLVFDAHEVYDHLAQSEDELAEINGKVMRKHQDDADTFVTINESIANYYRTNYPGFPRAIVVKNAAPRAPLFDYDGRLHEVARLDRSRRILIYQGGYAPKRGLLPLLLSSEYLTEDWTLVFMGWGRLETELRRAADALCTRAPELEQRIRFVPKVPQRELPLWTAGATLGAIPYENVGLNHWFCTPNKLWEYPNAGVPIIASPFPELRRIIEPNEIGWFLPDPLSPKAIGAAVNALTPEMLLAARARCLEFIASDNWDLYSKRLQAAYGSLQCA
ncbi:glycosyltransferase [Eleftheria terrae]|uniref:glycosyltransferase n=1 Tax=Eleftheria terrae TaxID=1597781 RepID=UPI00263BA45F|nr:glycosyltransferase [Eleftheria terrae]WKB51082.1 glycosyltransferase [Eleftheria terrae]